MSSATIREVQHNLAMYMRRVESGEEIQILRRDKPVARLVGITAAAPRQVEWPDLPARRRRLFGGARLGGKSVGDIILEERERA